MCDGSVCVVVRALSGDGQGGQGMRDEMRSCLMSALGARVQRRMQSRPERTVVSTTVTRSVDREWMGRVPCGPEARAVPVATRPHSATQRAGSSKTQTKALTALSTKRTESEIEKPTDV